MVIAVGAYSILLTLEYIGDLKMVNSAIIDYLFLIKEEFNFIIPLCLYCFYFLRSSEWL